MSGDSYTGLAYFYDALTRDVPYGRFADFYEAQFLRNNLKVRSILDLACGTGTLTCLLAGRGYDMIGTDASEDMLSMAHDKAARLQNRPLFLHQPAEELDLYGTVDAIICSLDGINYIPPEQLCEAFRRALLFLEPGGMLIFDIRPPAFLRSQDGQIFIDETGEVFCVWRARFDEEKNALLYGMDIFASEGRKWARYREEHAEYAHLPAALVKLLGDTGFAEVRLFGDTVFEPPADDAQRVFITARKPGL